MAAGMDVGGGSAVGPGSGVAGEADVGADVTATAGTSALAGVSRRAAGLGRTVDGVDALGRRTSRITPARAASETARASHPRPSVRGRTGGGGASDGAGTETGGLVASAAVAKVGVSMSAWARGGRVPRGVAAEARLDEAGVVP